MAHYDFEAAAKDYAHKAKKNNYKRLTHNVYLYRHDDHFTVQLFSTDIVEIHSDYQVLNPGGWHSMRTAKEMVAWSTAKGVWLKSGGLRINHQLLKRGDCPVINRMKIDNSGMPFAESITSDWVQRTKPEVVRAWKKLTMPLTKNLIGRFALGEFDEIDNVGAPHPYDLDALSELDPMFPDHDVVAALLAKTSSRVRNARTRVAHNVTIDDRWRALLNVLRGLYYVQNDGYMQVEVPNV